jgi:hypothetical protein
LVSPNSETDPVRRAAALALLAQADFTRNGVTNVPTADEILAVLPQANTLREVSPILQSPYTIQGALGVERQLPFRTTLAAYFITSRTLHQLRSRNINAPICPDQSVNCLGERPNESLNDVYQYESSGILKQNQLIVNFRTNYGARLSLFGNYRLGFAHGDTEGAGTFPAYSYDLTGEYGRSAFDVRHSFVIGGNVSVPWGVSLSPFIIASSGRPFNIVRGQDLNGDGLFTERPTYGQLLARCTELGLTTSYCNVGSNDPDAIIPRNFGQGPAYFSVNLRMSKNFGFGASNDGRAVVANSGTEGAGGRPVGLGGGRGPGGAGGGGGRRGGGGGGGRGFAAAGDARRPYNLNVGINFVNLFNNVNYGLPVGSLVSSRFGQSTSIAGGFGGFGPGGGGGGGGNSTANRRIELQLRFSW